MTAVVVALAVFAGLAGSVQVAVMGRFGQRIGVLEALSALAHSVRFEDLPARVVSDT